VYVPKLVPVIDERLWNQPPIGKSMSEALIEKLDSAIDNKLTNMIEDILANMENIPHAQYNEINKIN